MKRPRPETTKKGGKDGSSKRRAGGASAAADARQKKKSTALKRPAPKNALRSAQLEKRELLLFRKFGHGPRLFTKYYKAQRVAPARDFALSRAAFARSLPITFRTHVSHPTSAEFVFHKLKPLQKIGLIAPIPWMPPGEGWRCLDPVADQAQAGHHRKLHPLVANAVTVGVANGVCARQEAVSMLPVLALSRVLKPGDRVLDVCAAPGNKTMQLLELVSPVSFCSKGRGSGSAKAAASADNSATKTQRSGLVVANDGNPRRVDTLREALGRHKRDVHETGSLVVTCAMGQDIPVPVFWETVVSDSGKGKGSRGGGASKETKQTKGYHAVLADVPCSGDGTLRKDPDVLKRWHPGLGNALHATQVAIATNALRLVKPGGVLLYSTCSLNPVEDEAVVAAVLCGLGGDEFDLVANPLGVCGKKGLLHRKGVHHWRVGEHVVRGSETARRSFAFACANENANLGADSEEDDCDFDDSAEDSDSEEDVHCQFYTSFENAVAAGMPCAAATMWLPPRGDTTRDLHLDRCARILPHDQDTGGFFVAMLRRREAIETTAAVTTESADHEKHRKRRLEKTQKAKQVHASAAARATADWTDPVRPLPPGEALAIAETLGVGKSVQNRLWLGGKGTEFAIHHTPPLRSARLPRLFM
jgi:tRNA (cytosine34-C5)-methyltransferase